MRYNGVTGVDINFFLLFYYPSSCSPPVFRQAHCGWLILTGLLWLAYCDLLQIVSLPMYTENVHNYTLTNFPHNGRLFYRNFSLINLLEHIFGNSVRNSFCKPFWNSFGKQFYNLFLNPFQNQFWSLQIFYPQKYDHLKSLTF